MATRFYNHYGERRLVEPSPEVIRKVWRDLGNYLSQFVKAGVYQDERTINTVLHSAYNFVEKRLTHLLRRVASREFMELVLYQYDLAAELWRATPDGENLAELHEESHYASRRRALKLIAEETVLRSPPEYSSLHRSTLIAETEEAILCAEILVTLCMTSDRTYFLFPRHSQLTVFEDYELVPFQLKPIPPFELADFNFNRRLAKDRNYRYKCLPNPTADLDPQLQAEILDETFSADFGVRYCEFLNILARIMQDIAPAPGSYPIVFCHRDRLARSIESSSGIPYAKASQILAGFTLRCSDMKGEGRAPWNSKQTFRAYRRGFFEVPHPSGPHIAWSTSMADECLNWLVMGASFKKLPVEWLTPRITSRLDVLSHRVSSWFETYTVRCFSELGISGARRKNCIQNGNKFIEIPKLVGEIDFLGVSCQDQSLVVAECKMVESRMEPRFWKEDVFEFVDAKKSYAEKFRSKIKWILENRKAIGHLLNQNEAATKTRSIMLTLYPSFAASRIEDFPCVSLAEFFADHQRASTWPYQTGMHSNMDGSN
jgi:hypothetical protein